LIFCSRLAESPGTMLYSYRKNIVYSFNFHSEYENILKEVLEKCIERHSLEPFRAVSGLNPNLNRIHEELSRLYGDGSSTIDVLAGRSVYFYFGRETNEGYMRLAFLSLLTLLKGYMRSRGDRHTFEHMVVLEEAHEVIASSLLAGMYSATRKFGYTILAVSQIPENLDPAVYKLAGFTILMSGPESYVYTLQHLYSLTQDEAEHLLYGVRGNALLVRQGDPRPRKIRIKPHPQAL